METSLSLEGTWVSFRVHLLERGKGWSQCHPLHAWCNSWRYELGHPPLRREVGDPSPQIYTSRGGAIVGLLTRDPPPACPIIKASFQLANFIFVLFLLYFKNYFQFCFLERFFRVLNKFHSWTLQTTLLNFHFSEIS
jgi:hypothetical protein